jgi:S1-C subfamily serine protease
VGGIAITDLADFYTRVWACGPAGATIPLSVQREGDVFDLEVRSADRMAMMKKRRLN